MNDDERNLWIQRIEDYRSSGLTAIKWCENNGVSVHKLRYRINKFNKENNHQSGETKWASVTPSAPINSKELNTSIKVLIGNATVEIVPGFDPDTLKSIVDILGS